MDVPPDGKAKPETAAPLRALVDPDGASVPLCELSDSRKAEAKTWDLRSTTNVRRKHSLMELRCEPRSCVAHADLDVMSDPASADGDSPQRCSAHELQRVGDEVRCDADEDAWAACHDEGRIGRSVVDCDVLRLGFELQVLHYATEDVARARLRFTQNPRNDVSPRSGEHQESIDERSNALHRAAHPCEQLARLVIDVRPSPHELESERRRANRAADVVCDPTRELLE